MLREGAGNRKRDGGLWKAEGEKQALHEALIVDIRRSAKDGALDVPFQTSGHGRCSVTRRTNPPHALHHHLLLILHDQGKWMWGRMSVDTIPCVPGRWNDVPLVVEGSDASYGKERARRIVHREHRGIRMDMNGTTWPCSPNLKDAQHAFVSLVMERYPTSVANIFPIRTAVAPLHTGYCKDSNKIHLKRPRWYESP